MQGEDEIHKDQFLVIRHFSVFTGKNGLRNCQSFEVQRNGKFLYFAKQQRQVIDRLLDEGLPRRDARELVIEAINGRKRPMIPRKPKEE